MGQTDIVDRVTAKLLLIMLQIVTPKSKLLSSHTPNMNNFWCTSYVSALKDWLISNCLRAKVYGYKFSKMPSSEIIPFRDQLHVKYFKNKHKVT